MSNKQRPIKRRPMKQLLFAGRIMRVSDIAQMNHLCRAVPFDKKEEVVIAQKLKRLKWKSKTPTWSFVRSLEENYTEAVGRSGPKFINGVGIFRCRQTGQLVQFNYKLTTRMPRKIGRRN